jgi:hypothetical protein
MRRALVVIAVASLALVACGKDSATQAFPGDAAAKAQEFVRRESALGIHVGDARDIARDYGTFGDGFCVDEDPKLRNNDNGSFDSVQGWRLANIIVDIYCPWLSRFPEPTSYYSTG